VGAGNVLNDLIESGTVPVCRLTQVFRQAAQSLIVTNAHRVNRGEWPMLYPPKEREGKDCLFVEVEDSDAAAEMVVTVATKSMARLGFSPADVQVLAPMHRGAAGVGYLNERLQDAWNPAREGRGELLRGSRRFREGDRVIQLKNNYDKQVYNGDIGVIAKIDHVEQELTVLFSETEVTYDFADYDELQLAYALSIHKSQGSEYPAVILVLTASHYMMLQRNLLYTALTRARKLCVLIGEKRAIGRAVKNANAGKRFTRLAERLRAGA
jgi:exodeoxyribonuclease V alpha subunit